jgi:hypothetical protein
MIRATIYNWWDAYRLCSCGDPRHAHKHYRSGTDCSLCPCERFQWRIFKWVY